MLNTLQDEGWWWNKEKLFLHSSHTRINFFVSTSSSSSFFPLPPIHSFIVIVDKKGYVYTFFFSWCYLWLTEWQTHLIEHRMKRNMLLIGVEQEERLKCNQIEYMHWDFFYRMRKTCRLMSHFLLCWCCAVDSCDLVTAI